MKDLAPAAAAALAALDDPMILLSSTVPGQWRIAWVNDAWERATGWPAADLVGSEPGHLLGPLSDPDMVATAEAETRATGDVLRARTVFHHRDGSPMLVDLRAGVLPAGEDGAEWAWAQLRMEDAHYRSLLENISDTVVVVDRDALIRYASPSAIGFGHDSTSILGTSVLDLFDPAHREFYLEYFREALATPGVHGPWNLRIVAGEAAVPVEVVLNNRLDDPAIHGVVITARAAAVRRESEEALERRERRFRSLLQHATDVVILIDRTGLVRYTSPAVDRLFGRSLTGEVADAELWRRILHRDDAEAARSLFVSRSGGVASAEVRVRGADGQWRWLAVSAANLLDDPDVDGVVLTGHDITARKASEALLAAELGVLERMAASGSILPSLRQIAEVAEGFLPDARCSVGVMEADGVIRHRAAPTLPASIVALLDAEPADGEPGQRLRAADGWVVMDDITDGHGFGALGAMARRHRLAGLWMLPVRGSDAALVGVLAVFVPAARHPSEAERELLARLGHLATLALERSRFEARLRDQAVHDSLTQLPNRALLLDRVTQALEIGARRRSHIAVLFVDLDQFKLVNDSLGHAAGDELLRQVSVRFAGAVRRGDTVGRFGGDEFLVLAEDVAGETGAVMTAERLMATLEAPFDIDGAKVVVNASIGVALAGPGVDDVDADALIRNADAAMYRAKDHGRNRVAVFEDTLHAEIVHRYELEQGLRVALDQEELVVLYQPRVRLVDGRLVGVEALLRWDRPGHGRVGAHEIVPIAEDTGLIVGMGAWVLDQACRQAVLWDRQPATAGLVMAVNLSARQLGDPGLVDVVADTMASSGLPPHRLCLEVTESAIARDPDRASAVLTELKGLGVQLAIDDFGTGYATLDYVRRFSMADELKIDRSFVAGLTDLHSPDAAIVSAAIVLADALGFETVAEGVETAEQLAVLRRLGCAGGQGWYFGKPMSPDAFGRLF